MRPSCLYMADKMRKVSLICGHILKNERFSKFGKYPGIHRLPVLLIVSDLSPLSPARTNF